MDVRRHVDRRPARPRCSARPRSRPTRSSGRWAGAGSPSRSCPLLEPGDAGLPAGLQRRRQRLPRTTTRRPRSSLEYTVLGLDGLDYQPEDWTPVDSLAWLKAMAWDLRGNMDDEIERGADVGGPHARRDRRAVPALPLRPAPADRRPGRRRRRGLRAGRHHRRHPQPAAAGVHRRPARRRSRRLRRGLDADARAARPAATASAPTPGWSTATTPRPAKPLLANDPHLGVVDARASGTRWACTARTVGDGLPVRRRRLHLLRRARRGHRPQPDIAWGFTNLGPDVTDLYLEKVDGKTLPATTASGARCAMRDETIKVAGGDEPCRITVALDPARPAALRRLRPSCATVGANAPAGDGRARRAATATPSRCSGPRSTPEHHRGRDLRARPGHRLGRSSGRPPRTSRCPRRTSSTPTATATSATRRRAGSRSASPATTGDYPAPGWLPSRRLDRRVRPVRRRCPACSNPADGFIVTANQAVIGPDYPYYLGDAWDYGYRSQRIRDLLERRGRGSSVADMARIQLDTRNAIRRRRWCRTCSTICMPSRLPTPAASGCCSGWDFTQPADSAAAAYFNAVWRNTARAHLPRRAARGRCGPTAATAGSR